MGLVVGRAELHRPVRLCAIGTLHRHRAIVGVLALENLLGERRVREGDRVSIDGVQGVGHSKGDPYYLLPKLQAVAPFGITQLVYHLVVDNVLSVG